MTFETTAKLRFHHMDRAGMVFHGAYATVFQDAFEELMEHVGHVEKDLEPELGVRLPVVRHEMEFPAPPEGQTLTVVVGLERIGGSSAVFLLVARDPRDVQVAHARVVRVCIGPDGRSIPLPPELREAWEPHLRTDGLKSADG